LQRQGDHVPIRERENNCRALNSQGKHGSGRRA
jgi:hypothetical protein